MADLISKWTKEELFRLFTIAREEAQELDYDEFSVGMTMLLIDWRNTSSDRRVYQNRAEEAVHLRESVNRSVTEPMERSEVEPAGIEKKPSISQSKPQIKYEFESS